MTWAWPRAGATGSWSWRPGGSWSRANRAAVRGARASLYAAPGRGIADTAFDPRRSRARCTAGDPQAPGAQARHAAAARARACREIVRRSGPGGGRRVVPNPAGRRIGSGGRVGVGQEHLVTAG